MTIDRNPHPVFSVYWAAWACFTMYLFFIPPSIQIWSLWFAAFILVELIGVLWSSPENHRDTLSETMTWVQRKLSKHRMFLRGWNAALFVVVVVVAWVSVSQIEDDMAQMLIGAAIGIWLYDHWMSPDIHG
jgi:hypothetical protein